MNRRDKLRFILVGSTSSFGSVLTALCFANLAVNTPSAGSQIAIAIVVSHYFATALGGLASGFVARYLNSIDTIKAVERIRTALAAFLVTIGLLSLDSHPVSLLSLSFFLSLLEGVFHANRYAIIRNEIIDTHDRNIFIARVQSVDSSLAILGPAAAGVLVVILPASAIYGFDLITFAVSMCFFTTTPFAISRCKAPLATVSTLHGYQTILRTPGLLRMNFARVLNNVAYACWNTALPVIIVKTWGQEHYGFYSGVTQSLVGGSLFATNLVLPRLGLNRNIEARFLWVGFVGSLLISFLFLIVFSSINSLVIMGVFAVFLGLSTGGYRTAGIMIGQRITPPDSLHLVISAGDSVVRLATAGISAVVGFAVAQSPSGVPIAGIAGASAIGAFLLYKSLIVPKRNIQVS